MLVNSPFLFWMQSELSWTEDAMVTTLEVAGAWRYDKGGVQMNFHLALHGPVSPCIHPREDSYFSRWVPSGDGHSQRQTPKEVTSSMVPDSMSDVLGPPFLVCFTDCLQSKVP